MSLSDAACRDRTDTCRYEELLKPCNMALLDRNPSAAAVAGCGDDGWLLQRQLVPSEVPFSLQDMMVLVVAMSVVGWFSVL